MLNKVNLEQMMALIHFGKRLRVMLNKVNLEQNKIIKYL